MESSQTYRGAKNPNNPHERPLGKFLRGRERHVGKGYGRLPNGQVVRLDKASSVRAGVKKMK